MPAKRRSTGRKVGRGFAIAGKIIVAVALALAILVGGLLGYLTVTEYNPAYAEVAEPGTVSATQKLATTDIKLLTFNTGYGGLGEDADFFMDGGSSVNPQSKSVVTDNMIGIEGILREADADFVMLQEVDDDSARSFGMNQWRQYEHDLEQYETRFALNYSCDYVPYPLTEPIGKVHSGIATYSKYDISVATRYSSPAPSPGRHAPRTSSAACWSHASRWKTTRSTSWCSSISTLRPMTTARARPSRPSSCSS